MEAEIGHLRDGDELDVQLEGEDGEDLVAVYLVPRAVHGEHAVAVAVEGDAEVELSAGHGAREKPEVGRAAAGVDVRPVGLVRDRRH